jgi:hypothetical protein
MAARPENCKTQNFASRVFLGQPVLLPAVEKSFGARLTEEIARLGFAPVLSAKLQRIWVCLR